ncbi:MAG: S26 family signal peptidase, partial [Gemmataceae bacterium]
VEFPVNCSSEVDPSDGHPPMAVNGCICPNCRLDIKLYPTRMAGPMPAEPGAVRDPGWRSGDRVLVGKFVYDLPEKHPDRLDVVVFKFPGDREFPHTGPVKKHVPINYIKRLIGLPGETVAVHRGKIWLLGADRGLTYKQPEGPDAEKTQSWRYRNMHHDDTQAVERFNRGEFEILRKPPTQLLAMRRLVYDADHPARDLKGPEFQRWLSQAENGWSPIDKQSTSFRHEGNSQDITWLRYRHVLRPGNDRGPVVGPQLITDFMGYNTWAGGGGHFPPRENWASDLMVECEAVFDKLEGSFAMELSRGEDRYQALFDLNQGTCSLIQIGKNQEAKTLATEKVSLGSGKAHLLRFANMDDRLCVWVDEKLPFGDGVPYGPVRNLVPTRENDLERPVRLGSKNARVAVSKLKLYRDTYYTTNRGDRPSDADVSFNPGDSSTFSAWQDAPVSTYYVQPGHYLCLGDNSPESSDGRSWGLVPQRLLLGKAMLVYYPFSRAGRIR